MFVRRTVLLIAAVQLQTAFARSVDDVNNATASPANDVITASARGVQPTLFQQQRQAHARSTTTVSGGLQIQRKSSTPPTSFAAATRHGRPSFIGERQKVSVDRSLSFSSTKTSTAAVRRMPSDVDVSPTAAQRDATTVSSLLSDDKVVNTKSTSALVRYMPLSF